MNNDLFYQIALTLIPNVGAVQARLLAEHFGSAEAVFKASAKMLAAVEGIGAVRAAGISQFNEFGPVEEEMAFIEKEQVQPLFFTDRQYPRRLLHCYDAPVLLYYKGNGDLNSQKIVSIIGTRTPSGYGRAIAEQLVAALAPHGVLVVSGLAYGIDAVVHKTAIQNNMATVGVMANGLKTVYPAEHTALVRAMLEQGGVLTEFPGHTKPDRFNFPSRNRIVAGMADATIVVETAVKGGSMITAGLANSYNRDVFAFPGRTTDTRSEGCNELIRSNRAALLTDAGQLLQALGWEPHKTPVIQQQRTLFLHLTPEEHCITGLLQEKGTATIDEISYHSRLSSSAIAAAILSLEMQQVIATLPGKRYQLL
jgi:DNA processing protein